MNIKRQLMNKKRKRKGADHNKLPCVKRLLYRRYKKYKRKIRKKGGRGETLILRQ